MDVEEYRGLVKHKKALLRRKRDKFHLFPALDKYILSSIPSFSPFKGKTYRGLDLPAMAYVKEWLPELKYPGSAIQDGDEIYLKCYAGGDPGYVGMYDDYTPGSTTLTQMLGNSNVKIVDGTHVYWATWVPSTERNTEAMTFTVKKGEVDGVGRTWLQARKKGGGSQVVCPPSLRSIHHISALQEPRSSSGVTCLLSGWGTDSP